MTDGWIVIPRWDEFQHRDMARSTVPPWIKLYTKLMGDDEFRALSFHRRGILVSLWLEYAAARRQLRGGTLTLTRRLGQRVTRADIDSLSRAGFIEVSASRPAGNHASNLASLEVEVEKKVLSVPLKKAEPRVPFSAPKGPPAAPTPGRVNGPPTNVEAYVRGLVANGVITEPFELNDYDLDDETVADLQGRLTR